MIVIDSTRFEGCFTIVPPLEAAKRYKLNRYLRRAEARRDRCPWRVADDGASIVPRDTYTFGSGYDLWLVIVERWLISQGHVLSGFVRFHGAEAWDQGIFSADGRLILTRL